MKALYLLLFVSSSALANDAALLKCRAVSDVASRVACYDAIPVGAAAPVAAAPVAAAPVTAIAATAPAARPVAAATADQNFGIETVKRPAAPQNAIESTVIGEFEGWRVGSQIQLANGQVWRVVDGAEVRLPRANNQKVRIVRNMFGSTFMEVDGAGTWAKVRRLK